MTLITFILVFIALNWAWKKLRDGHADVETLHPLRLFCVAVASLLITCLIW